MKKKNRAPVLKIPNLFGTIIEREKSLPRKEAEHDEKYAKGKTMEDRKRNINDVAEEAMSVYAKYKELKDQLSDLKSELREMAEGELEDDSKTVELPTSQGVVQVTFKDDSYYVSTKDVDDVKALRDELGDAFDEIFTEKTSYKVTSDFQEKVREMDDMEKVSKVTGVATKRKNTPSVKFPKIVVE